MAAWPGFLEKSLWGGQCWPAAHGRGAYAAKTTPGRTSDRDVSAARFLCVVFVGGNDTGIITFAAFQARKITWIYMVFLLCPAVRNGAGAASPTCLVLVACCRRGLAVTLKPWKVSYGQRSEDHSGRGGDPGSVFPPVSRALLNAGGEV